MHGYQPGFNLHDILNNGGDVNNIDDMNKIEKLLQELKMKEDRDKEEDIQNRSSYLDEQEAKNDEDLRMLL